MSSAKTKSILELQEEASVWKVVIPSAVCLLNSVSCGTIMGFSNTAAITYSSPNATTLEKPLSEAQLSWLMSIIQIALIVVTFASGFVYEALGRKNALRGGQAMIFLGWVILYMAPSYPLLLIGRITMGVGLGVTFPTTSVYLNEISLIRIRGTLAIFNQLVTNGSMILSLALAATLPFDRFMQFSALPPVIFFLSSFCLPESPIWLVKKGRLDLAEQSLVALRGPQYQYKNEFEEMKTILTKKTDIDLKTKMKDLGNRTVFLPFCLMSLIIILQPLSGIDMLVFYSLTIFRKANVQLNNYLVSILCQSGVTLGYIISSFLMSRVPRKIHFIGAGLFMATNLLAAGIILQAEDSEEGPLKSFMDAMLPIFVILAGFGYGIGVGPVPFALMGEVLPAKVKAFACAILLAFRNAVTFFNLRFFPPIVSALGLHSAFWLYSGILFFNSILSAFILPETRGMSLTELEQLYQKKRSPRSTKSVSFCCIDSKEFEAKEK